MSAWERYLLINTHAPLSDLRLYTCSDKSAFSSKSNITQQVQPVLKLNYVPPDSIQKHTHLYINFKSNIYYQQNYYKLPGFCRFGHFDVEFSY